MAKHMTTIDYARLSISNSFISDLTHSVLTRDGFFDARSSLWMLCQAYKYITEEYSTETGYAYLQTLSTIQNKIMKAMEIKLSELEKAVLSED